MLEPIIFHILESKIKENTFYIHLNDEGQIRLNKAFPVLDLENFLPLREPTIFVGVSDIFGTNSYLKFEPHKTEDEKYYFHIRLLDENKKPTKDLHKTDTFLIDELPSYLRDPIKKSISNSG